MPFHNRVPTGHMFGVQLKSRSATGESDDYAVVEVETTTLNFWLSFHLPTVLAVQDLGRSAWYWALVEDLGAELAQRKGLTWQGQSQVSLRIPRSNALHSSQDFTAILTRLPSAGAGLQRVLNLAGEQRKRLAVAILSVGLSNPTFTLEQIRTLSNELDLGYVPSDLSSWAIVKKMDDRRYRLADYSVAALTEACASGSPHTSDLVGQSGWVPPDQAETCARIMALYFSEGQLPTSLVDSLFAQSPEIYVHVAANLFFLNPEKSQDLRDVDFSSQLIQQEGMGPATGYRLTFTTPEKAEAAKRLFREDRTAFELVPVGDEYKLVKLQHYENPDQEVEFRLFQPRGFSRDYSTGLIAGKMGKMVRVLEVRATLRAGGPPLALIFLDGPRFGMPQLMIDGIPFQAVEHQEGLYQESLDKKAMRLVVDGIALQEVRDQVPMDRIPAAIDGRKRIEAKLTPPFEHINCVGFLLPLQHERPSPDVLNALRRRYERVLEPDEPL